MKKNVRNALAISGLALAIGASGLTLTASASMTSNNSGLRFERHQNPSKIARVKKVDRSEKTRWHRRTISGIVSSMSTDSITITKGAKTFTVDISTETRVLNRAWTAINLIDIKVGDKIRVLGTLADTAITATTIRDVSLPRVN